MKNKNGIRLHKVIANAGYCSRRKAELLIAKGEVTVNKQIITDLGFNVLATDEIAIAQKKLVFTSKYYFLFNKPERCLTTVSDPKGRKTVMSYFSNIKARIYPVGRLDFDTSGLLIMTNDGDFTHAILHPKHKIDKVYQVLCAGLLSDFQQNLLKTGVRIANDFITSPAKLKIITFDHEKRTTFLHLTIYEGHKNQVKQMLKAVGSHVLVLKRIKIGNLVLDSNLKPGTYRKLTTAEINGLLSFSKKSDY